MTTRQQYSDEFKQEALRLWQTSGKSAREIETSLGISHGRLYRWQGSLNPSLAVSGTPAGERDPEVRRLQRELELVKQERDILKKAVAIFSQVQP